MRRLLYILLLFLTLPVVAQEEKLRQHGFSVSDDRKVFFAPGNLQYNAAKGSHLCADGTRQPGTWRFAENQWDYIGKENEKISATYNGWIDLFGWGTSGWNSGATAYQPWSISNRQVDYIEATPHDMTGEYRYKDWAVYNSIGDDAPETWRTLTQDEWFYLLAHRPNSFDLYGRATVNGTSGLVLLPDNYSFSASLPEFKAAKDGKNAYTIEQWKQLEDAGAVFLPITGTRFGNSFYQDGGCFYWNATQFYAGNGGASCLQISVYSITLGSSFLYCGHPVRPVMDIPKDYVPTVKMDTTVCDTLMPFTWHGLLFNEPGSQTIILKDEQGCDSIEIDYTLSTFHCEDFCLEGKLLFREDFGGNAPNDPDVSCINNPSILYRNGCNTTGRLPEGYYRLTKKDQGYYNHQWVDREDHSYPNDASRGYFLMIEGANNHLFYSTFLSGGAEGDVLSFSAYVINLHDNIHDGEYQLPEIWIQLINSDTQEVLANCIPSEMPIATHSEMSNWHIVGTNFTLPTDLSAIEVNMYAYMHGHEGNDFGIDDIELRLCQIPQATRVDTIICDTIDAITWRNKIYPLKNELRDTVYDSSGADSIYYILNVTMEHCCPEIKEKTITIGTLCDTLLPYTLYFRDTVLTFKMAGDILLEIQHPQWDCIDSIYILHLDTMHCERLYPIIVNKYNWQLLCHNVRVRELFPELTVTGYQWYKDGTAIPNATEDDYSEQNELQGAFQLRLLMSDGRYVWSEILTIQPSQTQAPSRIRIYNHNGYLFYQSEKETTIPSLPRGLYIIQIEQNGEQRIEKKLIP